MTNATATIHIFSVPKQPPNSHVFIIVHMLLTWARAAASERKKHDNDDGVTDATKPIVTVKPALNPTFYEARARASLRICLLLLLFIVYSRHLLGCSAMLVCRLVCSSSASVLIGQIKSPQTYRRNAATSFKHFWWRFRFMSYHVIRTMSGATKLNWVKNYQVC